LGERREQGVRGPRWGFGDAVGGFVVGIVLSSLIASAWLAAHPHTKDLSIGGQGLAQLGLWTGLLGSVVLASRRKGAGRLRDDFGFAVELPDVGLGLAAGVLAQVVLVPVVALLFSPFIGHPKVSGPVEDLVNSAHGFGLAVLVVFVVVGAPVVEELFFRGLVLRSLERRFGRTPAIIGTSVLFGLAHPQSLPAGALALVMTSLAAFGVVLAVLATRTGRLGPGIFAHAAFNAWTVVFLLAH
jgi:membrane protease YdiL (CAAX protease family)